MKLTHTLRFARVRIPRSTKSMSATPSCGGRAKSKDMTSRVSKC